MFLTRPAGRSSGDGRSALQHGGDPRRRSEQESGEKRGSDHVEAKQVDDFVQGNRLRSHQAASTTIRAVARENDARNPQRARVNEGAGVSIFCCSVQWERSQ